MDVQLPRRPKTLRRAALRAAGASAILLALASVFWREPGLPRVERDGLLTAKVEAGLFVVRVRGAGTLRPESIRWLTAESSGRVEEVPVQAGVIVAPDTLVVRLENLDLRLLTAQADREAQVAEAQLLAYLRQSRRERLELQAELATLAASREDARRRAVAYEQLEGGSVARLDRDAASDRVLELERRETLARQRLALLEEMAPRELDALRRQVAESGRIRQVRRELVEHLSIRAAADGLLQDVLVELGQWVAPGTPLAKVIVDRKLQAELRIAAEQAFGLALGQTAIVRAGPGDSARSTFTGKVRRIHPAASEGTVTVEVALDGPLPNSVRPDQNVDGSIETERSANTLHVARPMGLGPLGSSSLFRIDPGTQVARRVDVRTGKLSIDSVEILDGLAAGDEIIISDMSRHLEAEAIRLE